MSDMYEGTKVVTRKKAMIFSIEKLYLKQYY